MFPIQDAPNSLINPFSRQSINSMPSTGTYVLLRVQSMLQQNAIQKVCIILCLSTYLAYASASHHSS